MNISRRRSKSVFGSGLVTENIVGMGDSFDDDDIDDIEMVDAGEISSHFGRSVPKKWLVDDLEFSQLEAFEPENPGVAERSFSKRKSRTENEHYLDLKDEKPQRLDNGRWACNHRCKDKNT